MRPEDFSRRIHAALRARLLDGWTALALVIDQRQEHAQHQAHERTAA